MFSLNSANSVTKIFVITVKGSNLPPLVLETMMLPHHRQDTRERQGLLFEPNSCFSDLSNSLNSKKVLLHLGKTVLLQHNFEDE